MPNSAAKLLWPFMNDAMLLLVRWLHLTDGHDYSHSRLETESAD